MFENTCSCVLWVGVSAKADLLTPWEAAAVAGSDNWHQLDIKLRDKLYRRFGRATLPAATATEWASARNDRTGRRQITFLKLYLKDPTFGSFP